MFELKRLAALCVVLLLLIQQTETSISQEFRTWTSSDGKFTTEAMLIGQDNGRVVLKKKDGMQIELSIERLSKSDRLYLSNDKAQIVATPEGESQANANGEPQKYALLIGVTIYDHAEMNGRIPLKFPEEDARAIGKVLKESDYEVELLLGGAATKQAVEAKLSGLDSKANGSGICLVGLFGHGIEVHRKQEDGTNSIIGCFCPFDTQIQHVVDADGKKLIDGDSKTPLLEPMFESLVTMEQVMHSLHSARARNRVVLADCCRDVPHRARGRNLGLGANFKVSDLPSGTVVIFGCKPGEKALERDDWQHGAFSKAFLEEIQRLSVVGKVRTGALSDSIQERVQQITGSKQNPVPFAVDSIDLRIGSTAIRKASNSDRASSQSLAGQGLGPDTGVENKETSVNSRINGGEIAESVRNQQDSERKARFEFSRIVKAIPSQALSITPGPSRTEGTSLTIPITVSVDRPKYTELTAELKKFLDEFATKKKSLRFSSTSITEKPSSEIGVHGDFGTKNGIPLYALTNANIHRDYFKGRDEDELNQMAKDGFSCIAVFEKSDVQFKSSTWTIYELPIYLRPLLVDQINRVPDVVVGLYDDKHNEISSRLIPGVFESDRTISQNRRTTSFRLLEGLNERTKNLVSTRIHLAGSGLLDYDSRFVSKKVIFHLAPFFHYNLWWNGASCFSPELRLRSTFDLTLDEIASVKSVEVTLVSE